MTPQESAELDRRIVTHTGARRWEQQTRYDLYDYLRHLLVSNGRGIQGELAKRTGFSREWLRQLTKETLTHHEDP